MIDDDLRARLDHLASKAGTPGDPMTLVRTRAGRLRRRRAAAGAVAAAALVATCVAVPEVLVQQRDTGDSVGGTTNGCTGALSTAAGTYGTVARLYGAVSSAADLAAFRSHVGGDSAAADALAPSAPVPLCLVVGDLADAATSTAGLHYVLLSLIDGKVEQVYLGPSLPQGQAMPGVPSSQIVPAYPPPHVNASSTTAPARLVCSSAALNGVFLGGGLVDGLVQGDIAITNISSTPCALQGDLGLAALDPAGRTLAGDARSLPGPVHGVYGPMPVDALLAPAASTTAAGALRISVGGDPSAGACPGLDSRTVPAVLRLSIGGVVVRVVNAASGGDVSVPSVYGCPGRFYAGSVTPP